MNFENYGRAVESEAEKACSNATCNIQCLLHSSLFVFFTYLFLLLIHSLIPQDTRYDLLSSYLLHVEDLQQAEQAASETRKVHW